MIYRYCCKNSSSSSSSSSSNSSKSFPSSRFSCANFCASTIASSITPVGDGGFSGMILCLRRISFLDGTFSFYLQISMAVLYHSVSAFGSSTGTFTGKSMTPQKHKYSFE